MKKLLGVLAGFVPVVSFAAVDLSTVATAVETDLVTNMGLIGAALLAGAVAMVVYRWAKRAIGS